MHLIPWMNKKNINTAFIMSLFNEIKYRSMQAYEIFRLLMRSFCIRFLNYLRKQNMILDFDDMTSEGGYR